MNTEAQIKHTPGPWKQHTSDGKTYASVRSPKGQCVADCGSRSDQIAQANARLIAATPELLAALLELRTAFLGTDLARGYVYASDRKRIETAMADAGFVIAKATGS